MNYQLDGAVDTETDRYGLRLFAIADSYVNEVQTVSNSFSPEFGKIAGDIFNVITGSGTNEFHGQVTYIGRPLDLVARPILATPTTLLPVANDFAANAGGAADQEQAVLLRILRTRQTQCAGADHDHTRRMRRSSEFPPIC